MNGQRRSCGRTTEAGTACRGSAIGADETCDKHTAFDRRHPERPSVPFDPAWATRVEPAVGQWVRFERPFTRQGRTVSVWQRVAKTAFRTPGLRTEILAGWRMGNFTMLSAAEAPDLGFGGFRRREGRVYLPEAILDEAAGSTCGALDPDGTACVNQVGRPKNRWTAPEGEVNLSEDEYLRIVINHRCVPHWRATHAVEWVTPREYERMVRANRLW